ncbi:sgp1 monomeric G-protein, putative [Ricinus communis]|uniref:Sgp1 monomeric G-protein, putative n=1 Tax=Ricinus communis TaxID=3988 RepID=B9SDV9_RICCO|nr:sgp1 monomeric G-protein, putative [Ricinus communis]
MVQFCLGKKIQRRFSILRRCILRAWNQILMCSLGKPIQYHMLPHRLTVPTPVATIVPTSGSVSSSPTSSPPPPPMCVSHHDHKDSDLVALKISLLGDCQIGKTSFLAKYVGNEKEEKGMLKGGMNMMDKTLMVKGARISYNLWEVDGDEGSRGQIPVACKDSVAILIMFDLTSRVTLNGFAVLNYPTLFLSFFSSN